MCRPGLGARFKDQEWASPARVVTALGCELGVWKGIWRQWGSLFRGAGEPWKVFEWARRAVSGRVLGQFWPRVDWVSPRLELQNSEISSEAVKV